jgi:hypothetical protein
MHFLFTLIYWFSFHDIDVCLFSIFLWLHEQFLSCLVALTIAGDRAENFDTSMVLVALFI